MKMRWLSPVALLFMLFMVASASAESSFYLPERLYLIDDHAFEGTAVSTVYLRDAVVWIGDGAFADTPYLQAVYIPETVEFIGSDAFGEAADVTIFGIEGSFAARWAREHGYRFIHFDIWTPVRPDPVPPGAWARHARAFEMSGADARIVARSVDERARPAPKDRPEMYPLDYVFP